jgi:hypothetical protein
VTIILSPQYKEKSWGLRTFGRIEERSWQDVRVLMYVHRIISKNHVGARLDFEKSEFEVFEMYSWDLKDNE